MSENGKIVLTSNDGGEETFFVLEKADLAGVSYLLVADSEEEDANALVLRETGEEQELIYDVVEDEEELRIISKYFEELLEDVELRME